MAKKSKLFGFGIFVVLTIILFNNVSASWGWDDDDDDRGVPGWMAYYSVLSKNNDMDIIWEGPYKRGRLFVSITKEKPSYSDYNPYYPSSSYTQPSSQSSCGPYRYCPSSSYYNSPCSNGECSNSYESRNRRSYKSRDISYSKDNYVKSKSTSRTYEPYNSKSSGYRTNSFGSWYN